MLDDHPWYKRRGYKHFDEELSLKSAVALATDPTKVARHPFLPFLHFTKSVKKRAKAKKDRQIHYAAHADSHIYAYYTQFLAEPYEAELGRCDLGECVLAYRRVHSGPGRDLNSNLRFAKDVFDAIRQRKDCWALCFDVTGFFDHIDHGLLKRAWSGLLGVPLPADHFAVFKSITRYAWVDREYLRDEAELPSRVFDGPKAAWTDEARKARQRAASGRSTVLCTPAMLRSLDRKLEAKGSTRLIRKHDQDPFGIPQGSPISALLSNVYMLPLDMALKRFADSVGGMYRRYCDDILLVVPDTAAQQAETLVNAQLAGLRLEAKPTKTERVRFVGGQVDATASTPRPYLQYLGLTFDGTRIRLRHQSVARFEGKRARGIAAARRAAGQRRNKQVCVKPLLRKYSHLGRRNFVAYAKRAATLIGDAAILQQVRDSVPRVIERTR